ncbi:MAG: 3-phosphoserine/phosphohydroxythreonine transaminase [Gammaproteobacteria bacterium]|jgi:phosphoserine aminotransferase
MKRVYNFSAGPAGLPDAVIERAAKEFGDYHGSGMAVMEMSHRSDTFTGIAERAERNLRDLMGVPDAYRVLFLQGGATGQFAMVPLNLLGDAGRADYFDTGHWSAKAVAEARRFCEVNVAVDGKLGNYTGIPAREEWHLDPRAAYVHYTPNETIAGVEFQDIPDTGDVPLVADMSSCILSRPVDVNRFGVIYAGAQKNIGPAGLAVAIVREDLLKDVPPGTPSMFDYRPHIKAHSMYNTPPTFAWHMAGLVFEWLKEQGGVEVIAETNRRKAEKLYAAIDASDFYSNPVEKNARSRMNVPFVLADPSLDDVFLREAEAAGLANLKGHRSVGGMRASIYNAMPEAGVDALIEFMADFEKRKA